ncbi:MAG: UDP-N-acetylglucosamine 1-carboxyvinyltransferase [bacterium]
MDKYLINGAKRLKGRVKISGSKNAALPIIIATLLTDEKCTLRNIPDLADIRSICSLVESLGKKIIRKQNVVNVLPSKVSRFLAPYRLVNKMRASFLVSGPLLVRGLKAQVSLPGGCAIGSRPLDIHLKAFEQLGAAIEIKKGYVNIAAQKLSPNRVIFDYPSVGATENILMAASLLEGTTVIENAAQEPEVVDLAEFLNKMGVRIIGAGNKIITVKGRKQLYGTDHTVIPDRIETATFLIAGAITKGSIILENTNAAHLRQVIQKLKESGVKVDTSRDSQIKIKCTNRIKSVSIETQPYPGFPTDVQAQWMALMSVADGSCSITENVFENRFVHAAELARMGAKLIIRGSTVNVKGVKELSGAPVMVSDLRAGAALVLAGLSARGETRVMRIYHLDRGYEDLHKKLRKLGGNIRRVTG